MFLIPVDSLCKDSICNISKNSKQAMMLQHVRLIIWNEAVMQHWCVVIMFVAGVIYN